MPHSHDFVAITVTPAEKQYNLEVFRYTRRRVVMKQKNKIVIKNVSNRICEYMRLVGDFKERCTK